MKSSIVFLVILSVLLNGCAASNVQAPTTSKSSCQPGNRDVLWEELVEWKNIVHSARKTRIMYCVWKKDPYYKDYCLKLDRYNRQVNSHYNRVREQYDNTCAKERSENEKVRLLDYTIIGLR